MSDTHAPSGPGIPLSVPRPDQGWFGLRRLTVLLLAVLGAAVILGVGVAVQATIERDRAAHRSAESTVAAVQESLQQELVRLLHEYSGADAEPAMVEALFGSPSRAALIGRWLTKYCVAHIAVVADASGGFLQVAEAGEQKPAAEIPALQRDLRPFLGDWMERRSGNAEPLSGIVRIDGEPMFVAAASMRLPQPAAGAAPAAAAPRYLILIRDVGGELSRSLNKEFGFTGARVVSSPAAVNRAAHSIKLWNGDVAGYVTWNDTPLRSSPWTWVSFVPVAATLLLAGGLFLRMRKVAAGEERVLVSKDAEAIERERLIADIRTGIRQLSWNLTEGVLILEAAGEVRYANAAAGRLVGKAAEDILGDSYIAACEARFPALAEHLRRYLATDPGKWSGDASWFSTVGADGRMIKVGIHEFRRSEGNRLIGLLISETVWNQLGDPLDRIGIGVVCLDGGRQILAANPLAADFCRRLKAPLEGAGAAARLLDLLKPGLERGAGRHVASMALTLADAPEPLIATLIPVAAEGTGPGEQGVFVLLRDPGRALAADTTLLAELFGLTPAECRIAIRTTAGASAEAIAEELGLSPHTVRNHIKSMMKKTATSKQSETVALLWRLAAYTGGPGVE